MLRRGLGPTGHGARLLTLRDSTKAISCNIKPMLEDVHAGAWNIWGKAKSQPGLSLKRDRWPIEPDTVMSLVGGC